MESGSVARRKSKPALESTPKVSLLQLASGLEADLHQSTLLSHAMTAMTALLSYPGLKTVHSLTSGQ